MIYGGFWIGLRDLTGNTFTWENHDEVSFSLWREAEPQGYISNQEGCTAMAYSVSDFYYCFLYVSSWNICNRNCKEHISIDKHTGYLDFILIFYFPKEWPLVWSKMRLDYAGFDLQSSKAEKGNNIISRLQGGML